jgi:hypothetical protein
MFKEVISQRMFAAILGLVVPGVISCGGGTTGTSSTDTVKFLGIAEQADGRRAAFLKMTVRSGRTNESLEESGTDAKGDFVMTLPANESSLVVDVSGIGSTTVQRQRQGRGVLAAKLAVTRQGTLEAAQQYEVQIDEDSLCSRLASEGSELLVVGQESDTPCGVTLSVKSQQLTPRLFRGSVVAVCDGASVVLNSEVASDAGKISLDLQEAFDRDCRDIRLVVTSTEAAQLRATFPVR